MLEEDAQRVVWSLSLSLHCIVEHSSVCLCIAMHCRNPSPVSLHCSVKPHCNQLSCSYSKSLVPSAVLCLLYCYKLYVELGNQLIVLLLLQELGAQCSAVSFVLFCIVISCMLSRAINLLCHFYSKS